MRGEGDDHGAPVAWRGGSSPHARGGLVGVEQRHRPDRLIPACAGRASPSSRRRSAPPAHPRMRGEGRRHLGVHAGAGGSSPHARGGLRQERRRTNIQRLIPACAGRACSRWRRPCGRTAHPRMRGEGLRPRTGEPLVMGSSPHARGGQVPGPVVDVPDGLIPACAGRAPAWRSTAGSPGAHPGMRGEGVEAGAETTASRGSSPHARGGQVEGSIWG